MNALEELVITCYFVSSRVNGRDNIVHSVMYNTGIPQENNILRGLIRKSAANPVPITGIYPQWMTT